MAKTAKVLWVGVATKAFGNFGGEGCWGLLLFPWEEVLANGIPLGCGLVCWQTVEVELESWDHLLRQHPLCLRCGHVQMACGTKVWVSGSHHSDSGWRGVVMQQWHRPCWGDKVQQWLGPRPQGAGGSSSTACRWWVEVPTLTPGGSCRTVVAPTWWWLVKTLC